MATDPADAALADAEDRGRRAAAVFTVSATELFGDLEDSAAWRETGVADLARALREWECFALYACVRGIVAARGFDAGTERTIDALHEAVLDGWDSAVHGGDSVAERRARLAERYAEYGTIGREGGAAGASSVTHRLGEAAARHMTGREDSIAAIAELAGELHEALAETVAAVLRERSP